MSGANPFRKYMDISGPALANAPSNKRYPGQNRNIHQALKSVVTAPLNARNGKSRLRGGSSSLCDWVAENHMVDKVPRLAPDPASKSERDAILEMIENLHSGSRERDLEDELEQEL